MGSARENLVPQDMDIEKKAYGYDWQYAEKEPETSN